MESKSKMDLGETVSSKKQPKKKKASSLNARKARAGWWFVSPFIIGFVLIYLPIIFESISYSFCEIKNVGGTFETTFVGLQNYREALFVNESFVPTLLSGLQTMVVDIPMIVIFSLFMAVILNQKMIGRGFFRAIFFIPVILSTGLMESINASDMMGDMMEGGINDGSGQNTADDLASAIDLEALFANMKVGEQLVEIVTTSINHIYSIVNHSGVQLLIFLAGLQSISPAIYESCQIDGATAWETFWKITFPMISPMILVNSVYTIIDNFTTDDNVIMKFIEGQGSTGGGNTLMSAMSWIYFLIVIGIILIVGLVLRGFVFYSKRDA